MSAISRSTAIQTIRNSLRGYPAVQVSRAIATLSLPGRMSNSELTAYIARARGYLGNNDAVAGTSPGQTRETLISVARQAGYSPQDAQKIADQLSGIDQRIMPWGSTPDINTVRSMINGQARRLGVAAAGGQTTRPADTSGRTTAGDLPEGMLGSLTGAFRDGGWQDPDYWAAQYYGTMSPYIDKADQYWIDSTVARIKQIAGAYGKNPNSGWQVWNYSFKPPEPLNMITEFSDGGLVDWGSYGSSGSGVAAPVYVPPDRRNVEDMIRGQMARLLGRADEASLQKYTDLYMLKHREFTFDNPASGLDPSAEITEQIRKRSDFKRIHELRPDFVNEDEWVTMRQQYGVQAGLTANQAEQFAINQATVGTAAPSLSAAAATTGFVQGNETPEFVQRAKNAAGRLFQGVR